MMVLGILRGCLEPCNHTTRCAEWEAGFYSPSQSHKPTQGRESHKEVFFVCPLPVLGRAALSTTPLWSNNGGWALSSIPQPGTHTGFFLSERSFSLCHLPVLGRAALSTTPLWSNNGGWALSSIPQPGTHTGQIFYQKEVFLCVTCIFLGRTALSTAPLSSNYGGWLLFCIPPPQTPPMQGREEPQRKLSCIFSALQKMFFLTI